MFGLRNLSFHGQFRLVVDRFRVHASVVNVHHCVVGKICCRYYVYPRTVPAIAGVACHDRASVEASFPTMILVQQSGSRGKVCCASEN